MKIELHWLCWSSSSGGDPAQASQQLFQVGTIAKQSGDDKIRCAQRGIDSIRMLVGDSVSVGFAWSIISSVAPFSIAVKGTSQ